MSYRLLQKSKVSSSFEHNESENNYVLRSTDHIYFVICNSCYLALLLSVITCYYSKAYCYRAILTVILDSLDRSSRTAYCSVKIVCLLEDQ